MDNKRINQEFIRLQRSNWNMAFIQIQCEFPITQDYMLSWEDWFLKM
jgi:hypothetical protein